MASIAALGKVSDFKFCREKASYSLLGILCADVGKLTLHDCITFAKSPQPIGQSAATFDWGSNTSEVVTVANSGAMEVFAISKNLTAAPVRTRPPVRIPDTDELISSVIHCHWFNASSVLLTVRCGDNPGYYVVVPFEPKSAATSFAAGSVENYTTYSMSVTVSHLKLIVLFSPQSAMDELIGHDPASKQWASITCNPDARITLPEDDTRDIMTAAPLGVAIDRTSKKSLPPLSPEEPPIPPMPILLLLTSQGKIMPFNIVDMNEKSKSPSNMTQSVLPLPAALNRTPPASSAPTASPGAVAFGNPSAAPSGLTQTGPAVSGLSSATSPFASLGTQPANPAAPAPTTLSLSGIPGPAAPATGAGAPSFGNFGAPATTPGGPAKPATAAPTTPFGGTALPSFSNVAPPGAAKAPEVSAKLPAATPGFGSITLSPTTVAPTTVSPTQPVAIQPTPAAPKPEQGGGLSSLASTAAANPRLPTGPVPVVTQSPAVAAPSAVRPSAAGVAPTQPPVTVVAQPAAAPAPVQVAPAPLVPAQPKKSGVVQQFEAQMASFKEELAQMAQMAKEVQSILAEASSDEPQRKVKFRSSELAALIADTTAMRGQFATIASQQESALKEVSNVKQMYISAITEKEEAKSQIQLRDDPHYSRLVQKRRLDPETRALRAKMHEASLKLEASINQLEEQLISINQERHRNIVKAGKRPRVKSLAHHLDMKDRYLAEEESLGVQRPAWESVWATLRQNVQIINSQHRRLNEMSQTIQRLRSSKHSRMAWSGASMSSSSSSSFHPRRSMMKSSVVGQGAPVRQQLPKLPVPHVPVIEDPADVRRRAEERNRRATRLSSLKEGLIREAKGNHRWLQIKPSKFVESFCSASFADPLHFLQRI